MISRLAPAGTALLLLAACATTPRPARLAPLTLPAAESVRVDTIAPGLVHYDIWSSRGPWAIQLLDADRACWSAVALKAGGQAIGRAPARELVQTLADTSRLVVGGGMNADFFTFQPPGIPIGAHVSGKRVISGPFTRPVLAFDSAGAPWTGVLAISGWVRLGADSLPLGAWNQRRMSGLRLFDRYWGAITDSASGTVELAIGGEPARVIAIDTTSAGSAIPDGGIVLIADSTAPASVRARLRSARLGESVAWRVWLTPSLPAEAVGGFPVLVSDSVPAADLNTAGGAGFAPVRHPRTAVGIAAGGRRLLFVVVDGRQQPFSDGMTLRELADLFLRLGAPSAINLDGGGSSELVVNRAGVMAIANRPSDNIERPVANALALVQRGCRPSP
jgi:hypothetical protein